MEKKKLKGLLPLPIKTRHTCRYLIPADKNKEKEARARGGRKQKET
jgi:hypothetical protein